MRILRAVCIALTLFGLAAGPALALPVEKLCMCGHWTTPQPSSDSGESPFGPHLLPFALAGAIRVKDTGVAASKFRQRASAAAPDYARGVEQAAGEWETQTAASEANYEQAVTESIARKAFGRGVRGSGGKYAKNAKELGTQRYPQGIANAEGAYATGVGPYLDTIKGLQLPPRRPKGQNMERANIVAAALRARKTGS
jgi:hypothetical protein